MFALLECVSESPVLHFTYSTCGLDDNEWHHTTLASTLVDWVNSLLIPLAKLRGASLTVQEIAQTLYDQAQAARVPFEDIDWLGLALLTEQRYRESVWQVSQATPPEIQEDIGSKQRLAKVCADLYQELTCTKYEAFRRWVTCAA